jgi:hypothetical protein
VAADQDLVAGRGPLEVIAEVVAELVGADFGRRWSGARGTRTPDPLSATQVLSQLSYSPRELEICRKVNTRPLAVQGRSRPQKDAPPPCHERDRKKVATVLLTAVDGDRVNLVGTL